VGFGSTDTDGDAICDERDNCPSIANPSQADCDGNAVGDACETAPDTDGDGIPEACDLCLGDDATVDPCIIDKVIDPAEPKIYDLGSRGVRVIPGGQLVLVASTFRCGSFSAETGTTPAVVVPANGAAQGTFKLFARGICANDPSVTCQDHFACSTGSCVGGDVILDGAIDGSGTDAANIEIRAAGHIDVLRTVDIGGRGIDGAGGGLDLRSDGDVSIGGTVDADGAYGGDISVDASGDVVIDGADLSATAARGSGDGGIIDVRASGAIRISGATTLTTDGHRGQGDCGFGGEQRLDAGRSIFVADTAVMQANGPGPDCDGGIVSLYADRDILFDGTMIVEGTGSDSAGGDILLDARGTVSLASTAHISARGGYGDGRFDAVADLDVVLDGEVDLSATTSNGFGGVATIDANRQGQFSGYLVVAGESGVVDVAACTVELDGAGRIETTGTQGLNKLTGTEAIVVAAGTSLLADETSGENRLVHGDASSPPTLLGTVTPTPIVIYNAALPPCRYCGNTVVDIGEECDDGNYVAGDGCAPSCIIERCGDSVVQTTIEECDDGNLVDGDGCDSNCTFTRCGNAIVTPPEACDDGNLIAGDGCSSTCAEESADDRDSDGLADDVDPCVNVGGAQDIGDGIKLTVKHTGLDSMAADEAIALKSTFRLASSTFAEVDPSITGVRLVLRDVGGAAIADVVVPGGAGWSVGNNRRRYKFSDGNDPAANNGIARILIIDREAKAPRQVRVVVRGRDGSYAIAPGTEPVSVSIAVGDPVRGQCGEATFDPVDCSFDGGQTTLHCRR